METDKVAQTINNKSFSNYWGDTGIFWILAQNYSCEKAAEGWVRDTNVLAASYIWVTVTATGGVPFIACTIKTEIREFGQGLRLPLVKSNCVFLHSIRYFLGHSGEPLTQKHTLSLFAFFFFLNYLNTCSKKKHDVFIIININNFRSQTRPFSQKCTVYGFLFLESLTSMCLSTFLLIFL